MNNTRIEWCDSTWNPVTGCLHGCEYCYARIMANRFKGYIPENDDGATGVWYHEENLPLYEVCEQMSVRRKSGKIVKAPYPFGFAPTLHYDRLFDTKYLKSSRNIFVCSMADLFGDWVPDDWIREVFEGCAYAPQHNYLFLTKNPKRYLKLAEAGELPKADNMWYGSTVTTPDTEFFFADGYNTFLSIEPILEDFGTRAEELNVNWLIIGAETGKRKDKVIPLKEWIDEICKSADMTGVPVFMKDSLIPIVGEENMRREFPAALGRET